MGSFKLSQRKHGGPEEEGRGSFPHYLLVEGGRPKQKRCDPQQKRRKKRNPVVVLGLEPHHHALKETDRGIEKKGRNPPVRGKLAGGQGGKRPHLKLRCVKQRRDKL